MQGMFDSIKGELKGGKPTISRTIATSLAEGVLAKGLGDIQKRYEDIDIGSYPIMRRGAYGVNLVLRGRDEDRGRRPLLAGLEAGHAGLLLALADLGPYPLEHVRAHVPAEVRLEDRARMHGVGRDAVRGPPPVCLDREQNVGRL